MVSHYYFYLFIIALAFQRLFELKKSKKNQTLLLKKGGREHGAGHFPSMVLLHSTWLIAMPLEVFLLSRPLYPAMAIFFGCTFFLGQILRVLAIRALKDRWTTRIITVPGLPPVTSGVFRYFRHPNYLGVVLEIVSAPLIHTAWITATMFSLLNLWLLKVRIKHEEQALTLDNDYRAVFDVKKSRILS